MRWLMRPRRERGVTAVFFALSAIVLFASAGVGIDVSSLVFERSKVQHGVDAGALAIAQSCVRDEYACPGTGANSEANDYLGLNDGAGTADATFETSTRVRVDGTKSVGLFLMDVLGFSNSDVTATATAQWTKHPKKATVIPYLVSLCEYARNRDTDTDVYLRTDINESVKGIKKADKESILGPGAGNLNILDTCAKPSYVPSDKVFTGPDGNLHIMRGGVWIPKNDNSNEYCSEKLHAEVFVSPPLPSGKNTNCIDKWGDEIDPAVSGELLLAIYAPVTDAEHDGAYGGIGASPAADFGSGNAKISDTNGSFKLRVIGFAPFHVVGYCLDGTQRCNNSSTPDALYGHFVSSTELFDEIDEWSDTGAPDLGVTKIEMVN